MGFHSPSVRPAIYSGKRGMGGAPLDSHEIDKNFTSKSSVSSGSFFETSGGYKVGPLPFITRFITPISRVITPVTQL